MKPSYPTPADLLQRCIETIPSKAVVQPRPLLESPSRTRLLLLAAAATVPIAAVLIVIPVNHYMSQRRENTPEDASGNIPYRRSETYIIEDVKRDGSGTKQYSLTIADVRGEYRGDMKPDFKEEDENHRMNFLLLPGIIYTRTRDKVSTFSSAGVRPKRDNKSNYSPLLGGGKLVSEGIVLWEGQKLLKRVYVVPAFGVQKKFGYYAFRRELFSDPGTHTLRGIREWAYFTKDDPTKAKGAILCKESHIYYNRRPEDAQYFDVNRFMKGATVVKRFTDKDLQKKAKRNP